MYVPHFDLKTIRRLEVFNIFVSNVFDIDPTHVIARRLNKREVFCK